MSDAPVQVYIALGFGGFLVTDGPASKLHIAYTRTDLHIAALAARDARIAALEAGLRPFAERAERYDPPSGDDEDVDWSASAPRIKLKHLRAARALLDGGKG